MSGINSNVSSQLVKSLPVAFFPLPLDPSNLPWIIPSIPIELNQSLSNSCSDFLSSKVVCEAGSTEIKTFSDSPTISERYIIYFHINAGVNVNFIVEDKIQVVNGPMTVPLITTTSDPPVPLPMKVPQGHVVQQIVDETGILRHVIISPLPPPITIPAPDDISGIGMKDGTLDIENAVESDPCDRGKRNSDLDEYMDNTAKSKISSTPLTIFKELPPDVIVKPIFSVPTTSSKPDPQVTSSAFKLKLSEVAQVLKQKTNIISYETRVGIISVICMIALAIFISFIISLFIIVK